MCFHINENYKAATTRLKRSKKPIIGYKLLGFDYRAPYHPRDCWKINKPVISTRSSTQISEGERNSKTIDLEIHLYRNKPYQCPYRCPCPYLCPYEYNRWMKVQVRPEDLVMANETELVCTKCLPVEEIKYE